jgi:hypothetical protein
LVVCLFLLFMYFGKGSGGLLIKADKGIEFKIDVKNEVNVIDLLNGLLTNNKYQNEILAILESSFGLYKKESSQLIYIISKEDPRSQLSENIRELLVDLKGPFNREFHSYYDIKKPSVVDVLIKLKYDHPVAVKLRDLSDEGEGIFFDRGKDVEVSIANSNSILDQHASVCTGCKYFGRYVTLQNSENNAKVRTFLVDNSFLCREQDKLEAQIMINQNDGNFLYGGSNPNSKMKAILYSSKKGYIIQPTYVAQQ